MPENYFQLFIPNRNLCPMNICDTCDDRSRGDLSKNALTPAQKVRTGPVADMCVCVVLVLALLALIAGN
jgi:hypothetical protein